MQYAFTANVIGSSSMGTMRNLLIALLLLSGITGLQYTRLMVLKQGGQQRSSQVALRQSIEEDRLRALNQLPALGFDNLFADGVYLAFIQYFGDRELRRSTGYGLSALYFDALIDRDPKFIDSYIYISNTLSLYLAQAEQSVALMEKGLASLAPNIPPRSYYVWRFKAIDELLFLGDGVAAQKSYENSANWAKQSSDEEAPLVAQLSAQTAQFLARNPVSRAAQISAWTQVLLSAKDEQTQKIATERIELLGGTVVVNNGGQVSVQFNIHDE
ncbi:MAG: hypothetical protein AAFR24_10435 [Cyanobacteria bacterium J06627_3]